MSNIHLGPSYINLPWKSKLKAVNMSTRLCFELILFAVESDVCRFSRQSGQFLLWYYQMLYSIPGIAARTYKDSFIDTLIAHKKRYIRIEMLVEATIMIFFYVQNVSMPLISLFLGIKVFNFWSVLHFLHTLQLFTLMKLYDLIF